MGKKLVLIVCLLMFFSSAFFSGVSFAAWTDELEKNIVFDFGPEFCVLDPERSGIERNIVGSDYDPLTRRYKEVTVYFISCEDLKNIDEGCSSSKGTFVLFVNEGRHFKASIEALGFSRKLFLRAIMAKRYLQGSSLLSSYYRIIDFLRFESPIDEIDERRLAWIPEHFLFLTAKKATLFDDWILVDPRNTLFAETPSGEGRVFFSLVKKTPVALFFLFGKGEYEKKREVMHNAMRHFISRN